MKIAIAGLFDYYMYEEVCAVEFEKIGHTVIRIPFGKLSKTKLGKIEFFFTFRFLISFYYCCRLLWILKSEKPDILICWRTTWLYDWVLNWAKTQNITLISYNNDDSFSPNYKNGNLHQRRLWSHFIEQIPIYDINLVYRPVNLIDYQNAGGQNVHIWMPYYIPNEIQRAMPAFEGKPIDVIFIGHWEEHREVAIQYLIDKGIDVQVYGTGWMHSTLKNKANIKPLYNEQYFGYIKSSKIALAFLSKLNRDVYTRRNFEIPACNTIMFSQYTEELSQLFKENESVFYFVNPEELYTQIAKVLPNYENIRYKDSPHSISDRISTLLNIYHEDTKR